MRIRKHASRLLLGTQSTIPPHPSPSSFNSSPCGVDVCELNCSPWDLAGANKTPNKGADGSRGISGNCTNVKEEEKQEQQEPITVSVPNASTNADCARAAHIRIEEEGKKGTEPAIRYCNKRGRGWHCTRPAEPAHPFCTYHLGRLRAYMSNRNGTHNNKNANNDERTSQEAVAVPESDSYYYYGGFVPWRGKRRATAEAEVIKVQEELKAEEEAERSDVLLVNEEEEDGDVKGDDDHARIVLCNKRGRGWHCTRPAERPHSFCNYHLTILRSYVSGRKSAKRNLQSNKKSKKKQLLTGISASDDDSDAYHDGGGFDPWKGKRRGGADVKVKARNIADCIDINPRDDPDYDLGIECGSTFSRSEASLCRKRDGKGWHCKRPAQPPHSYCSHHLGQNRNYTASNQQREIVNTTTEFNNNKRAVPTNEKLSGGQSDVGAAYESNFYYYDGFGPCQGKSRGRRAIDLNIQVEEQAQEEEEEEEVIARETNSGCSVPVVADDYREREERARAVALNLK